MGISIRLTAKFQKTFPLLYEVIFYLLFGGIRSKIFDKVRQANVRLESVFVIANLQSLFPAIAPTIGGDVALKVLVHYDQLHKTGRFGYFDYGKSGNLAEYGQESPPDYNIQNIKAPVAVFFATKDYLAAKKVSTYLYVISKCRFLRKLLHRLFFFNTIYNKISTCINIYVSPSTKFLLKRTYW